MPCSMVRRHQARRSHFSIQRGWEEPLGPEAAVVVGLRARESPHLWGSFQAKGELHRQRCVPLHSEALLRPTATLGLTEPP